MLKIALLFIPSLLVAAEPDSRAADTVRRAAYDAFISGKPIAEEHSLLPIIDSCRRTSVDGDEDLAKACSLAGEVARVQSGTDGDSAGLRQQAFGIIDLADRFVKELGVENGRPSDEVVLAYRNRRVGVTVAAASRSDLAQRRQREAKARALAAAAAAAADAAASRSYSASRGMRDPMQYTSGLNDDSGYFIIREPDGTRKIVAVQSWKNRNIVRIVSRPNESDRPNTLTNNSNIAVARPVVVAKAEFNSDRLGRISTNNPMKADPESAQIAEFVRQFVPEKWR